MGNRGFHRTRSYSDLTRLEQERLDGVSTAGSNESPTFYFGGASIASSRSEESPVINLSVKDFELILNSNDAKHIGETLRKHGLRLEEANGIAKFQLLSNLVMKIKKTNLFLAYLECQKDPCLKDFVREMQELVCRFCRQAKDIVASWNDNQMVAQIVQDVINSAKRFTHFFNFYFYNELMWTDVDTSKFIRTQITSEEKDLSDCFMKYNLPGGVTQELHVMRTTGFILTMKRTWIATNEQLPRELDALFAKAVQDLRREVCAPAPRQVFLNFDELLNNPSALDQLSELVDSQFFRNALRDGLWMMKALTVRAMIYRYRHKHIIRTRLSRHFYQLKCALRYSATSSIAQILVRDWFESLEITCRMMNILDSSIILEDHDSELRSIVFVYKMNEQEEARAVV